MATTLNNLCCQINTYSKCVFCTKVYCADCDKDTTVRVAAKPCKPRNNNFSPSGDGHYCVINIWKE